MKKPSTKIYFCIQCVNGGLSPAKIEHKDCSAPFHIVQATVTFDLKRTRYQRFLHWLFRSNDLGYCLAFTGAVIINVILLPHFNLSFKESLLESFCLGLVLIRLLKDD